MLFAIPPFWLFLKVAGQAHSIFTSPPTTVLNRPSTNISNALCTVRLSWIADHEGSEFLIVSLPKQLISTLPLYKPPTTEKLFVESVTFRAFLMFRFEFEP